MADGTTFQPEALATAAEIAAETARVYPKLESLMPRVEWQIHAPLIAAINRLKREKQAVILAHNYMTPEIFHGVGDIVGDSLALAKEAAKTDAPVIVQAGVHFMAETSKILCPDKTVLIPDMRAGCSLAASITADDVVRMRAAYPGVPVVTYVNTSAAVKAMSDICCTSANAVQVVESLGVDRVILLPDQFLARNVAAQTDVKIITWLGACEVHERFTADDITDMKASYPDAVVLAHPECPPDVLRVADFAGSTAAMAQYVIDKAPKRVVLVTECSMADNITAHAPNTEFLRPCNLCPHMKRITLQNIYESLVHMRYEVQVDASIADAARTAIERMIALPAPAKPARYDLVRAQHQPDVELFS
jgi:quinolinate synthase